MSSSSTNSGVSTITVTFDVTRDPDIAAVDVQNRVNQALGRLPAEVRQLGVTVQKVSQNFIVGRRACTPKAASTTRSSSRTTSTSTSRTRSSACPASPTCRSSASASYSMRVWLDPIRLAARASSPPATSSNALREQNVNVAAGSVGDAPARDGPDLSDQRARGRPPARAQRVRERHRQDRRSDGTLVRLRDVGSVELGAETYSSLLRFQGARRRRLRRPRAADGQRARRSARRDRRRWRGSSESFPPGLEYRIAFDTTTVVQESIAEVVETLADRDRPGRPRDVRVPPELARHADSGADDAGLADRRLRVREPARLLDQHAHAVRHRPGHGHRRRRCDRGDREHRAAHAGVRQEAADAGGVGRDARGVRAR